MAKRTGQSGAEEKPDTGKVDSASARRATDETRLLAVLGVMRNQCLPHVRWRATGFRAEIQDILDALKIEVHCCPNGAPKVNDWPFVLEALRDLQAFLTKRSDVIKGRSCEPLLRTLDDAIPLAEKCHEAALAKALEKR